MSVLSEQELYRRALMQTAEEVTVVSGKADIIEVRTHEHKQARMERLRRLLEAIDRYEGVVTEEQILAWAREYCEAPATVRICVETKAERATARMRREVMGYGEKGGGAEHPRWAAEVGGPAKRAGRASEISLFAA